MECKLIVASFDIKTGLGFDMNATGYRFRLNLDDENRPESYNLPEPTANLGLLVKDIQERDTSTDDVAPAPPSLGAASNGLSKHGRRGRSSKSATPKNATRQSYDQEKRLKSAPSAKATSQSSLASSEVSRASRQHGTNKEGIDEENNERISQMSEEEISAAQKEIESALSPSLIEMLLKRANIDDNQQDAKIGSQISSASSPFKPGEKVVLDEISPSFSQGGYQPPESRSGCDDDASNFDPDAAPAQPPADLQPVSTFKPQPLPPGVHFPTPRGAAPELDPSSPAFLDSLRETYFPNLPADPSNQSWMSNPVPSEAEAYSPSKEALPASSIRFDFRGHLLPPRLSAQIPSNKGLHHHGHAPESAGYTIPELAHLARSTVPAQRSIAYQTLGRILYRLGRGDFGQKGEELYEGLWDWMEKGRVVEGMAYAATQEGGNRTVWATATEALWLWRKGGGRQSTQ